MVRNGFSRSTFDSCVYVKRVDSCEIFLLLYVDDMLIASKNKNEVDNVKRLLGSEFEMKDMGPAKKILGMEITRHRRRGVLFLSQCDYLRKVVAKFGMSEAKAVHTPSAAHFKLSVRMSPKTEKDKASMERVPYASAVGSLMYAMVCTRPDLAYAASLVSRFMANPGREHWEATKWVLRFIKGTSDVGLLYRRVNEDQAKLRGFVDADFAGDLDKRRSLTGYVFTLFGYAVSWKAQLQPVVALSTTEAEYIAVTEGVKEYL